MRHLWTESVSRVPIKAMRHPELVAVHALWLAASSGGLPPRQTDLQLDTLRPFMHKLALVELEAAPAGARYLVVGPHLRGLLGRDPSGKRVEQFYSRAVAREVYEAFSAVGHTRQAAYFQRDLSILGQQFGYHRLLLPLRSPAGDHIARLIVAICPIDERFSHASQWHKLLARPTRAAAEIDALAQRWAASATRPGA